MMACLGIQLKSPFPTEIPKKAAQGFITSAAIHFTLGQASGICLLAGAVAVLATVIEAVIRPIMQDIFGKDSFIANWILFGITQASALGVGAYLFGRVEVLTGRKSGEFLFLSLIAWLGLNWNSYNENKAIAWIL